MGKLVDGVWKSGWNINEKGAYARKDSHFRDHVTAPEAGRYHLYAAHACPWAQRTLITRAMRGLEEAIAVTLVAPKMGEDGWEFSASDPDPLFGAKHLREIYLRASPTYTGNVTVPVLWDKKTSTIVNNESREIMRMLDVEFEALAKNPVSLAPPEKRAAIDAVLDEIYTPINNGVYRAGFAITQNAYEEACTTLFAALDTWEQRLSTQRFTTGSTFTEADVALFTTFLRFDLVYYAHFKCNVRRLRDYPSLWGFTRDVYQMPAVKSTCNSGAIKTHYYWSQDNVNPHRIVPLGPTLDLDAPHDRAKLSAASRAAT